MTWKLTNSRDLDYQISCVKLPYLKIQAQNCNIDFLFREPVHIHYAKIM